MLTSISPGLIAEQDNASFSRPETHCEAELQSEVVVLLFVKSQINQRSDIYISLHISGPHLCRQTHTDIHSNPITQSPSALTVHGLWSSSVGLLGVDGEGEPEGARERGRKGAREGGRERGWEEGREEGRPLCRRRGGESGGVPAGPVTHHTAELRRKLEISIS